MRNRKQHDNTARHWTELHARPGVSPPSTSPSPPSVGTGSTGPPSRSLTIPVLDAQRLFESIQSRQRSRTLSVQSSQTSTPSVVETPGDTIIIESDREESSSTESSRSAPADLKRKRGEPHDDSGRHEKRVRTEPGLNEAGSSSNPGEVIVIEDDE